MPLMRDGDEPIPGYKLVKKLGQGGFGSVWKAEGPGVSCALKFLSLGDTLGRKEYQAIRLLRNIRHPNLIPMAAFWLRDGNGNILGSEENSRGSTEFQARNTELIIQLGLGDKSLADRLAECRGGQPATAIVGLPADELLRYMVQAASAIDYLNRPIHALGGTTPAALRHGDIKPGNMLISGDGVWVCDFGLAGILGGSDIRTSVGKPMYTPAYAAPEILSYKGPSKSSDQYSLAVSYVELRTGRLPYDAETKHAVEALITIGDIYLDFMSGPEQKVLRRAMAMNPDDRFPTCSDFVEELKKAVGEQSGRMGRPPTAEDLFCRDSTVVPGFKLETCLGRGGYGEVWQATGNRVKVALKVVKNLDDKKGKQEWAALESIKEELDHPHLMKLQGYWLFDAWGKVISEEEQDRPGGPKPAYLVIYTDLAAKNLLDRLKECQKAGQNGIPIKELLEYMRQSADALDYLNQERHSIGGREGIIIHRDIKPENILLTHKSKVKISDFGLAKMMEGSFSAVSRNSEGWTLIYGAPELHKRNISRWTDQYSLAVTYYHLRTGHPPIDTSLPTLELAIRSGLGQLDLSGLPDSERAVIARATNVTAEQRFDTCSEMVAALYAAAGSALPPQTGHEMTQLGDLSSSGTTAAIGSSAPSSGPSRSGTESGYQREFPSAVVAELPKANDTAEALRNLGIKPASDTHSPRDEVRDTPGPNHPDADRPSGHHPTNWPSSGDFVVPKPVQSTVPPTATSRQTFVDDYVDRPGTTTTPTTDWRGDSGRKATTRPAPAPDVDDWRRPRASKPPLVPILAGGGVALAAIVGLVIYFVSGGKPPVDNEAQWLERLAKIVSVENPARAERTEAADLVAKLESAKHTDAKSWHGKVDAWIVAAATKDLQSLLAKAPTASGIEDAESRLQEIKSRVPEDQFVKLDRDVRSWKNPSKKQREVVQVKVEQICQGDDGTVSKAAFSDVEAQATSLKSSSDSEDVRIAENCLKLLGEKKVGSARALMKSMIRGVPKPPLSDKAAAAELKTRLDELQSFWLVNAQLALEDQRTLAALQALASSWAENKVDKAAEVLRGSPGVLATQLISEFLRLSKPGDRGSVLAELWTNREQLPTDAKDYLVGYRDQLRRDLQKSLAANALNKNDLMARCSEVKVLDPNDALADLVQAELQWELNGAALNAEQENRIRRINDSQNASLNPFYLRYIRAVARSATDAAGAADEMAAIFPDRVDAEPLSQAAFRRKRAAGVLMTAIVAQQRDTKNPFELPIAAEDAKKVEAWIGAACRLESGNRQAWTAAAVLAAYGPTPNVELEKKAINELSKGWPDEKTAGKYWFLLNLMRADRLANASTASERGDSLASYVDALNGLKRSDAQIRGSDSMSRLKAVFQKAIELGEKLHSASSGAATANRLAQIYGLRGGWIYDRPLDWGHPTRVDAYIAAAADLQRAMDLAQDRIDKTNYRVGRIKADLFARKITPADAEKETTELTLQSLNTPRPHGLLAYLKKLRAQEFINKDQKKFAELYVESLTEYEKAISLCRPPDDNLRKAYWLSDASDVCRTLAVIGLQKEINTAKASDYDKESTLLKNFDDAMSRSMRGKRFEDLALSKGDVSLFAKAVVEFDKAIEEDAKPQYYVDRGRITLRGVAFARFKWSDLERARIDLNRIAGDSALKDPRAATLRAEASYFLSYCDILNHKLKQSAASFEAAMRLLPNDAHGDRFAFLSGRGRSLAIEAEWLLEDQQSIPDELIKELNSVAESLSNHDKFETAWLRGVVAGLEKQADPVKVAERFLAGLPAKFPAQMEGFFIKMEGTNFAPGVLPLMGWLHLYLDRYADIDPKGELTLEKLCALADTLAEAGRASANQDLWLWASAVATSGQAYIYAANKQVNDGKIEQNNRERSIALLREATGLVSPNFPTTWNWRYQLGRELERSLSRTDLSTAERKKRIGEAKVALQEAKDVATDAGKRKIEVLLERIGTIE